MISEEKKDCYLRECIDKMKAENMGTTITDTFSFYYRQVANGADGLLYDRDIEPVDIKEVTENDCLTGCQKAGAAALSKAVRIVLNGGLGTTMGLTCAKSLIQAKEGLSFLDIILAQAKFREVALCFMNSFNTHNDTVAEIKRIGPEKFPLMFVQNKFPKILRDNLRPARWSSNSQLEWNPPGHGDVYISLYTSGLLEALLKEGIEYAFISNSDNLGASLNLRMLGFFSQRKLPFMMEVSQRKPSDAKGGHIARHRSGRMILRESAQCPSDEMNAFQDISKYRFFNTNNIWINLNFLDKLITKEGFVPLPLILNPKPIDPRNDNSPGVYQIETAMGSAISLFEGATAVLVPRSRFMPVKSCNDLLILRSDRYLIEDEMGLKRNPEIKTNSIEVRLDPNYYKRLDDFEKRFPEGAPSLLECSALNVVGNIYFGKNIKIIGNITISHKEQDAAFIPNGSVIDVNMTV